ncbi:MAG: AraC family transcriptional regulator [Verrucomicrobiae bacterium]|nr:AraC family transcriptional regulator [Verrucomicrobiae bacterium]
MHPPEFYYHRNSSPELAPFPHIEAFCRKRRNFASALGRHLHRGIELVQVISGRFHWDVEGRQAVTNPHDFLLTCPWQQHSGMEDTLNAGAISWLILNPARYVPEKPLRLGAWSGLSRREQMQIGRIFAQHCPVVIRNFTEADWLITELWREFDCRPLGHVTRINHLLDEILLLTARRCQSMSGSAHAAPRQLQNLLAEIPKDLRRAWRVPELCRITGLKPTTLTGHFKRLVGMSPLNHLINLRVEAAKRLLRETTWPLTRIALETGFSSSQHFSAKFRKYTGRSPKDYRKFSKSAAVVRR